MVSLSIAGCRIFIVILTVVKLNDVMLSAVILSVVAPFLGLCYKTIFGVFKLGNFDKFYFTFIYEIQM
jgi:hypothetical protein